MQAYVSRHLTYVDDAGRQRRIPEAELCEASRRAVVLGEPGMGKSALLERFAARSGWALRSATSFVHHPRPEELVTAGEGIVIDGLDELLAGKEAEPINRVLRQLIAAGRPPFVISCRAADWRGAIAARDLGAEYGDGPVEFAIEPFGPAGAVGFLTHTLGAERSAEIVGYLDRMGMPEFYGNPLTLRLFGEVASAGGELPRSRADLLLQACRIMWGEESEVRQDTALAALDDDTALSAAGVLSAALILTGSEAVALKSPGATVQGVIHATALRTLPGGSDAPTMVGSRLFVAMPNVMDRFKPVHRTVAEFLGARWLARSLHDDQARGRALAMLRVHGGVPASLRGLHAWLAQDSRFAGDVIETDPYGVLRYGDADGLDVDGGRRLLASLRALQHVDPYFRAEDWATHSAKGLTHPEMREDLRAVLLADDTTPHLRTLLLGIVRGSAVAAALAGEVAAIALDVDGRFSSDERRDAAMVIAALDEGDANRRESLARLAGLPDQASTRLVLEVMRRSGFAGVDASAVAAAVLSHLGPLDADTEADRDRDYGSTLFLVAHDLPDALLSPVLDVLARMSGDPRGHFTSARQELGDFATILIVRGLEEGSRAPGSLLRSMRLAAGHHGHSDGSRRALASHLRSSDGVRRAIQELVLLDPSHGDGSAAGVWRLGELSLGLLPTGGDTLHLLGVMAASSDRSDQAWQTWASLVATGLKDGVDPQAVMAAARPFAGGDAELVERLEALLRPRAESESELRLSASQRTREQRRLDQVALAREKFAENETALRAGDPRWTHAPAQTYLGMADTDGDETSPEGRLERWLGPALRDAALAGLEAGLSRPDMPTPEQIAEGYGQGMRYRGAYPLLAGVVRHLRDGGRLEDLRDDLVEAARIVLWREPLRQGALDEDVVAAMDAVLRRDPARHERYARLLVEPSLDEGRRPFHLLPDFLHSEGDREVACRLVPEWLERHPDLPIDVELAFVDLLAETGSTGDLRTLCDFRIAGEITDDGRRRIWDAVELMVSFGGAAARLGGMPNDPGLLWAVRHRLGGGHYSGRQLIAVPAATLAWLIRRFRPAWPAQAWPSGVQHGDENTWDATDYIHELVARLAAHPQGEAELEGLAGAAHDGYTAPIRHALEQRRAARRESDLAGMTVDRLRDVVEARPPQSTDDLAVVVRFALERLRGELRGSDTDVVNKYWSDDGDPRLEDPCTDRLIEDLRRLLPNYGIKLVPQRDMPGGKRADVVVTLGDAGLPIECKGQWNRELWTAADQQLDKFYLRDWQSQDRGVYIVYWFGADVPENRRLHGPPRGSTVPSTPEELRRRLLDGVAPQRRNSVLVEVLDLTR